MIGQIAENELVATMLLPRQRKVSAILKWLTLFFAVFL
jgi:hypothetical protein